MSGNKPTSGTEQIMAAGTPSGGSREGQLVGVGADEKSKT